MNILILDSDPVLLDLYKEFIEDNIKKCLVKSYDWKNVEKINSDDLIYDIMITNMSDEILGENLISKMRRNNTKIIIITGDYDKQKYKNCYDAFLWKPINFNDLLKELSNLVEINS